jgi:hypothetical protein
MDFVFSKKHTSVFKRTKTRHFKEYISFFAFLLALMTMFLSIIFYYEIISNEIKIHIINWGGRK